MSFRQKPKRSKTSTAVNFSMTLILFRIGTWSAISSWNSHILSTLQARHNRRHRRVLY